MWQLSVEQKLAILEDKMKRTSKTEDHVKDKDEPKNYIDSYFVMSLLGDPLTTAPLWPI